MPLPLDTTPTTEHIRGFRVLRNYLDLATQRHVLDALRNVIEVAPLMRFVTAWGKPMSVRMTSAGRLGWVIDRGRYRYSTIHPETGEPWPPIPEPVLEIWRSVSGWPTDPDCCLTNWYGKDTKMGLHQDKDEGDFAPPVVSISLGDPARFRMGGLARKDPTEATVLNSGDVVVMGGEARLGYHGVDRVMFGEGSLLPDGGRINLTLRVVQDPSA